MDSLTSPGAKERIMRISHLIIVATGLLLPAKARANCYVLVNNTNATITWRFRYNSAIGAGNPISIQMIPHGRYPAQGQWCWNNTGPFQATVLPDNGNYKVSWNGTFVMGDGSGVSPSGTYSLEPTR